MVRSINNVTYVDRTRDVWNFTPQELRRLGYDDMRWVVAKKLGWLKSNCNFN